MDYTDFKTINIIDDDFAIIEWRGIQLIYYTPCAMFNATKLCQNYGKRYGKWIERDDVTLFKKSHPELFYYVSQEAIGGVNRNTLCGTYLHMTLIIQVISWCDMMAGYNILNGMQHVKSINAGYIYIVQTENYYETSVYKVGRTGNIKRREKEYIKAKGAVTFHRKEKVSDVVKAERELIDAVDASGTLVEGREWFEIPFGELEYIYNEIVAKYSIDRHSRDEVHE